MVKKEKQNGFISILKQSFSYISQIISESIFPPIIESADKIMDNIEERINRIEKRMWKKLYSLLMICFGLLFLIFSLFFYLTESARWNNATALFSIGITIFVFGLLLKLRESDN